jgi:hypothetical protein
MNKKFAQIEKLQILTARAIATNTYRGWIVTDRWFSLSHAR